MDRTPIELDAVQIDLLASLLAQSQPQGVATMRLVVGLVDTLEAAERELPEGERRRSKVRGPVESTTPTVQ